MRNINKYLFLMMLVLSMFSLVSAAPPVTTVPQFPDGYSIEIHPIIDYFKAGQDITLNAHVENSSNGYPINDSITCWLHLYNSTGQHLVIQSTNTTDHLYDYEFYIKGGNFTKETKSLHIYCFNGNIGADRPYTIEVTPTGEYLDTPKAISYSMIFVVSLLMFIGLLIGGIALPSNNKSDKFTGYVIAVRNMKYVKYVLLGLSYITLVWISYFIWMISYAYLDFEFLSNILRFIFTFLAIATLPSFILFAYITITNLIKDSKITEALSRGLRVNGK